ncbi:hypothetical protein BA022_15805 [Diaphorobacter nitroreducens]|uniref:helix-turn-helix domain-containing protein n=1 Tax=Diaphorobacter nitroreducens TaxID=164759 RepID=UPI000B5A13B0|nr:helix-turn-helix transcriptional regulator [Diaphorobacter nitroreducens]ASI69884.1 hypothetical protein BA022_15805 [Diaphorobacter nitroreducens]
MSQQALAEQCGVTARSQRNYESGERLPDAGYLAALPAAGVDVLYVLTGERSGAHPAHDAAEQVLLDSYRRCNAQARQHLIQTAALLAAGMPPASARGAGSSGGQSVVGDDAIQIGSVTGKARIKNR